MAWSMSWKERSAEARSALAYSRGAGDAQKSALTPKLTPCANNGEVPSVACGRCGPPPARTGGSRPVLDRGIDEIAAAQNGGPIEMLGFFIALFLIGAATDLALRVAR